MYTNACVFYQHNESLHSQFYELAVCFCLCLCHAISCSPDQHSNKILSSNWFRSALQSIFILRKVRERERERGKISENMGKSHKENKMLLQGNWCHNNVLHMLIGDLWIPFQLIKLPLHHHILWLYALFYVSMVQKSTVLYNSSVSCLQETHTHTHKLAEITSKMKITGWHYVI